MLVIRKQQLDRIHQPRKDDFENSVYHHLDRNHQECLLDLGCREDILPIIRKGVELAARYGITIERDVARFIEIMFENDPGIYEARDSAWMRTILEDQDITGTAKVRLIDMHLSKRRL